MAKKSSSPPVDYSKISVQELYRPCAGIKLPDVPLEGDTTSENALFWEEEMLRCIQGWRAPNGKYLCPLSYFYYNHCPIVYFDPNVGANVEGLPLYAEKENELFEKIYFQCMRKSYKPAVDLIAAKARGKRWSYGMRGLAMWVFVVVGRFQPRANGLIGLDTEESYGEWRTSFMATYESLHPFFKYEKIYPNRADEIGATEVVIAEDGTRTYKTTHSIYLGGMNKTPGKFQRLRALYGIFDEYGKFTKGESATDLTKDCFVANGVKYGFLLKAGTSDTINNKTSTYRDDWLAADAMGVIKHTIFADELFHVDRHTGKCLRSSSRRHFEAERQKLKNAGKSLSLEIQNNPLDEEELFFASNNSELPTEQIQEQVKKIIRERLDKRITKGKLEWVKDVNGNRTQKVKFVPDAEGHWEILDYEETFAKMMEVEGENFVTVDDFYKDEAPESRSEGAILVYRKLRPDDSIESDLFIARYQYRPSSKRKMAEEVMKTIVAFNVTGKQVFVENNDGSLVETLERKGFGETLVSYNGQKGIRNSDQSISNQMVLAHDWFENNRHQRLYFLSIIDHIKKPNKENSDTRSCFLMMMQLLKMTGHQPVKDKKPPKYAKKETVIKRMEGTYTFRPKRRRVA